MNFRQIYASYEFKKQIDDLVIMGSFNVTDGDIISVSGRIKKLRSNQVLDFDNFTQEDESDLERNKDIGTFDFSMPKTANSSDMGIDNYNINLRNIDLTDVPELFRNIGLEVLSVNNNSNIFNLN